MVSAGSLESLKNQINLNYDGVQDTLKELLKGESYPIDISQFKNDIVNLNTKDDIFTLLVHLGYLTYYDGKVRIPNQKVTLEFITAIKNNQTLNETNKLISKSYEIVNATINCKDSKVSKLIEEFHENYFSLEEYNNCHALSSCITLAYLTALNN